MSIKVLLDEIRDELYDILTRIGTTYDYQGNGDDDKDNKSADSLSTTVKFEVSLAKPGFGDASSNIAFLLARTLKKSPADIAKIIADMYNEKLTSDMFVSLCVAHRSGFVNFEVNWKKMTKLILSDARSETFGDQNIGKDTTITVEHTSVNPNKALHIGHIRNIIIGDSISRILKKAGYKVNVLNYVDDSGLQVADVVVGFQKLGFSQEPPPDKTFAQYCGDDVYVKTTERYNTNPELEQIRRDTLKEIEDQSTETSAFADKITRRVLADQLQTCWRLSVYYDCLNFESHIIRSGLWSIVFEKLKDMKLLELDSSGGKNNGCWVIRDANVTTAAATTKTIKNTKSNDKRDSDIDKNHTLAEKQNNQDKVIVRSNGTATYIAKDIPYAAWKLGLLNDPFDYMQYPIKQPDDTILWQTTLDDNNTDTKKTTTKNNDKLNFAGDIVITVIDSRQSGLQKIITDLMRRFKSNDEAYVHLAYESVTLSADTAKVLGVKTDGKAAQMSGRRGLYVDADAIYDMLYEKIASETIKRHPNMTHDSDVSRIAHAISAGTIRYEMLKQDLDKIITFDLTHSLSLEGNTASYIQYTVARASRILEKSKRVFSWDEIRYDMLKENSEINLIKLIGSFDVAVYDAAKNLSPKVVARYCHDLATGFNTFYEQCRVLGLEDDDLADARLCLVYSFRLAVTKALNLIGIKAPDVM